MTIHREGITTLLLTLLALVSLNALVYYVWPEQTVLRQVLVVGSVVAYLLVLQFFRNPRRVTDATAKQVVAPADGKVVVIEETVEAEYFNGPRRQISIFMSPVNVHINRSPISGVVSYFKYHPGKYLVAWHPKSSTENERTTVVVKNEEGTEVLFRQIAGAMARRIKYYVKQGDAVKQGEEFGFIKFGSRVDVFVPLDAKILIKLNDRPVGGQTILAELA
jgi:phosphatidylserine decarboxylase